MGFLSRCASVSHSSNCVLQPSSYSERPSSLLKVVFSTINTLLNGPDPSSAQTCFAHIFLAVLHKFPALESRHSHTNMHFRSSHNVLRIYIRVFVWKTDVQENPESIWKCMTASVMCALCFRTDLVNMCLDVFRSRLVLCMMVSATPWRKSACLLSLWTVLTISMTVWCTHSLTFTSPDFQKIGQA